MSGLAAPLKVGNCTARSLPGYQGGGVPKNAKNIVAKVKGVIKEAAQVVASLFEAPALALAV